MIPDYVLHGVQALFNMILWSWILILSRRIAKLEGKK